MYHQSKVALLIALLLVSTNLAGCAQSTDVATEVPTNTPEPTTPAPAPADLAGTFWMLDSYPEITLEFEADQMAGNAGCNSYFASYAVKDNSLTLGPIGSTMMACETEVNERETQYLSALESVVSYRVVDDQLDMLNADGETVLTYTAAVEIGLANPASVYCEEQGGSVDIRAESGGEVGYCVWADGSECEEWAFFRGECAASLPQDAVENALPSEVLGIAWQWSGLVETEPASQSLVPHPENYTLLLQPDGSLEIKADCNVVNGSYVALDGGAISIQLGPSTAAFCGEASLDQQYLELLNSVDGYASEDGHLTLNLEDGAGNMLFDQD